LTGNDHSVGDQLKDINVALHRTSSRLRFPSKWMRGNVTIQSFQNNDKNKKKSKQKNKISSELTISPVALSLYRDITHNIFRPDQLPLLKDFENTLNEMETSLITINRHNADYFDFHYYLNRTRNLAAEVIWNPFLETFGKELMDLKNDNKNNGSDLTWVIDSVNKLAYSSLLPVFMKIHKLFQLTILQQLHLKLNGPSSKTEAADLTILKNTVLKEYEMGCEIIRTGKFVFLFSFCLSFDNSCGWLF
jgi:hypothetical protein